MCDSLGLQNDCMKGPWPPSNTVHLGLDLGLRMLGELTEDLPSWDL